MLEFFPNDRVDSIEVVLESLSEPLEVGAKDLQQLDTFLATEPLEIYQHNFRIFMKVNANFPK